MGEEVAQECERRAWCGRGMQPHQEGHQDAAGGGALLAAGRGVLRAHTASAVAGGPGGPRSGGQCSTREV